jgi:hypothetical protein
MQVELETLVRNVVAFLKLTAARDREENPSAPAALAEEGSQTGECK